MKHIRHFNTEQEYNDFNGGSTGGSQTLILKDRNSQSFMEITDGKIPGWSGVQDVDIDFEGNGYYVMNVYNANQAYMLGKFDLIDTGAPATIRFYWNWPNTSSYEDRTGYRAVHDDITYVALDDPNEWESFTTMAIVSSWTGNAPIEAIGWTGGTLTGRHLLESQIMGGGLTKVVPGVAYVSESESVKYNGTSLTPIDFVKEEGNYTWEDFGVTAERYNSWVDFYESDMAAPESYKVTIGEEQFVRVSYDYDEYKDAYYMGFRTATQGGCEYAISVYDDGAVIIERQCSE